MKKTKEILGYSVNLDVSVAAPEDAIVAANREARLALSQLFAYVSQRLRKDNTINFVGKHKITLECEMDKWDARFVLKMEKTNDN